MVEAELEEAEAVVEAVDAEADEVVLVVEEAEEVADAEVDEAVAEVVEEEEVEADFSYFEDIEKII